MDVSYQKMLTEYQSFLEPDPAGSGGCGPGSAPARLAANSFVMLIFWVWMLTGAAWPAAGADLPRVLDIALEPAAGSVELTITTDRRLPFLAYALSRPDRLVVDFPEVEWRNDAIGQKSVEPFVIASRYGRFSAGKSRLVIELDQPFSIQGQGGSLDQPHNYTITISLRPQQPVRFADPDERELEALREKRRREAAHTVIRPKIRPDPDAEAEPNLPHIIILDAGHGGIDPGAVAKGGILEKDIVLAFAKELRRILEQDPRFQVVLTRDGDEFVRLRQRLRIAKQAGADLFISIHADSLRKASFRGASVYTLSATASDDEAERLAAQENKSDILSDTDLSPYDDVVTSFLIDLVRRDTFNKSIAFAELLVDELGKVTKLVRKNRRFAGFVVLKSPETPSVLLELGFLSNAEDARELQNAGKRAVLAQAVKAAILRYFATDP